MIEDIDYKFISPANDPSMVHIKLLDGEFKDTVFKFGKVKFEEKDNEGYLHFDYDVLESTVMKPKKLEKNEDFKNFIGNMLVEIISKNLEQEFIDENGTTDTEESD
mgnify:FL=1